MATKQFAPEIAMEKLLEMMTKEDLHMLKVYFQQQEDLADMGFDLVVKDDWLFHIRRNGRTVFKCEEQEAVQQWIDSRGRGA